MSWAVSDQPLVWQCARSIIDFGFCGSKGFISRAHSSRAARNLATSMKKSMPTHQKNDSRGANSSIASPAAARLFNDHELAYLASQSTAIACECPTHLAELITRLLHFELYSAECESRSAEDAALHAYLHKTTSRARNMMERALARVVELENMSLLPNS